VGLDCQGQTDISELVFGIFYVFGNLLELFFVRWSELCELLPSWAHQTSYMTRLWSLLRNLIMEGQSDLLRALQCLEVSSTHRVFTCVSFRWRGFDLGCVFLDQSLVDMLDLIRVDFVALGFLSVEGVWKYGILQYFAIDTCPSIMLPICEHEDLRL
jgi:hypothetical protein